MPVDVKKACGSSLRLAGLLESSHHKVATEWLVPLTAQLVSAKKDQVAAQAYTLSLRMELDRQKVVSILLSLFLGGKETDLL